MSILDSKFRYVHSTATNIRKTFERERKRLAAEEAKKRASEQQNVRPLKKAAK
jgi:hypothetical protein